MKPRHLERMALRDADAFARYAKRHSAPPPRANADAIARRIARKHCAGRAGSFTGAEILEALHAPPAIDNDASRAVAWMLATVSVPECMQLVMHCGVRLELLARHVRARPQKRNAIVRFLNQFAIPAYRTGPGNPVREDRSAGERHRRAQ